MLGTKEILTVGEVAVLRGIPTKAVYNAIKSGELVAVRYNAKTIRIDRSAIIDWVANCRRRAPAQAAQAGTTSTGRHNSNVREARAGSQSGENKANEKSLSAAQRNSPL